MINSLKDLEKDPSQEILVMLKSVEQKVSADGAQYQKFRVRDTCENETNVFNWDTIRFYTGELPVVIKLRVESSRDMLKLREYSLVQKEILPFLPQPRIDIRKSWSEIVSITKNLRPSLEIIVEKCLMKHQKAFLYKPLTEDRGYARTSGLLESTLKMAKLAISISEVQTFLDKDLLIAASILYNIGTISIMNDAYTYALDNVLIGTNISSFLIIKEAYDELQGDENINDAEYKLLTHIVTSKNPSFPEAVWILNINKTLILCDRMEELIAKSETQASSYLGGTPLINNKLFLS